MKGPNSSLNTIIERASYFVNNQRGLFLAGLFTSTVFWTTSLSIFACKGEILGMYLSMLGEFVIASAFFIMLFILTKTNPGGFNGPQDFRKDKIDEETWGRLIRMYNQVKALEGKPMDESPQENPLIDNPNQFIRIKEETIDVLMSSKGKIIFDFKTNELCGFTRNSLHYMPDREFYNDFINVISSLALKHNQIDISIERENNDYKPYSEFHDKIINSNLFRSTFSKTTNKDLSISMDIGSNQCNSNSRYYRGLVVSDQKDCILN